eukprot:scaffold48_cov122-Skeletonema_menzelii.AAC.3
MIARAFFRLLPFTFMFMCLLMVASAKTKNNDTPSRRLSSPRQLKGMDNIIIKDKLASSPPIVDNDRIDPADSGNRNELRFLEKNKGKKRTKKKKDSGKESPDYDGIKGKTMIPRARSWCTSLYPLSAGKTEATTSKNRGPSLT